MNQLFWDGVWVRESGAWDTFTRPIKGNCDLEPQPARAGLGGFFNVFLRFSKVSVQNLNPQL